MAERLSDDERAWIRRCYAEEQSLRLTAERTGHGISTVHRIVGHCEGRHGYPPDFVADVLAYYLAHPRFTQQDVAEIFGVSRVTLVAWVRKHRAFRGGTRRPKGQTLDKRKILAEYRRRGTYTATAKVFGCSANYVYKVVAGLV